MLAEDSKVNVFNTTFIRDPIYGHQNMKYHHNAIRVKGRKSTLHVNFCNFTNIDTLYNGAAISHEGSHPFNQSIISNSHFINNLGTNGGAIYIENPLYLVIISNNSFVNNSALMDGSVED